MSADGDNRNYRPVFKEFDHVRTRRYCLPHFATIWWFGTYSSGFSQSAYSCKGWIGKVFLILQFHLTNKAAARTLVVPLAILPMQDSAGTKQSYCQWRAWTWISARKTSLVWFNWGRCTKCSGLHLSSIVLIRRSIMERQTRMLWPQ